MAFALQAPLMVAPAEPITVTVDIADALGVGLTLQLMVRDGRIPAIAAEPYQRLGAQLVAAARAAAKGIGQ
jgi:hypothetical protein